MRDPKMRLDNPSTGVQRTSTQCDIALWQRGLCVMLARDLSTMSDDTPELKRDRNAQRGGRPALAPEARRSERISFSVTKKQKAAFLINAAQAGLSSNDYARAVLCQNAARAGERPARSADFELVDNLARIGTDLARIKHIALETGVVPDGLTAISDRLERQLDRLTVGSRLADELGTYRHRLLEIGAKLETRGEMSERARGMIARFDAVIAKVLSA